MFTLFYFVILCDSYWGGGGDEPLTLTTGQSGGAGI